MKKQIAIIAMATICLMVGFNSQIFAASYQTKNYATNEETFQVRYTGYIQFVPSYRVSADADPSLSSGSVFTVGDTGENVKRAYINYVRDNESVSGGRVYTATASSKTSSSIFSTSTSVWDTLNPFAVKTKFYYDWEAF